MSDRWEQAKVLYFPNLDVLLQVSTTEMLRHALHKNRAGDEMELPECQDIYTAALDLGFGHVGLCTLPWIFISCFFSIVHLCSIPY